MAHTIQHSFHNWRRSHDKISPKLFVDLAIQLVQVIQDKHQLQGAIGNLQPSQIYISADGSSLSWSFYAGERQLSYMAPEQLGMMDRGPDIRSDMYVLGIILYELYTGKYPYSSDPSRDWASIHLYDEITLHDQGQGAHEAYIFQILRRLLSKSPDERYQSAYGLLYDLLQLEKAVGQGKDRFRIGEGDAKQTFQLRRYQIKHVEEINQLAALRHKLANDSFDDLHVVLGEKNIGKTTLLSQYQDYLIHQDDKVITLQCSKDNPESYHHAKELQTLLLQLLLEQDSNTLRTCTALLERELGDAITMWKSFAPLASRLWNDDRISDNGQTLFDSGLCLKAVMILCQCVHPAAILIDQLEHIDEESYQFLCELVKNKPYNNLLIVAACQSSIWDKRFRSRSQSHTIEVPLLSYIQIREWIEQACQEDSIRISQLSRMVYHWSYGNPGRILSLFDQWQQQNVFYYDEQLHSWQWHAGLMSNLAGEDENWKAFMRNLSKLPQETTAYLKAASVIGIQFSIAALAHLVATDERYVKQKLHAAMMEGIIAYHDEGETQCLFLMNELQEHIYQSIEADARAAWHLIMGRSQVDRAAVSHIYHLNRAIPLLSATECLELARLNAESGMRAYHGKKYKQAAVDFKFALQVLEQHEASSLKLQRRVILYLAMSLSYCNEIADSKQYFQRVEHDLNELDDEDYLAACQHQIDFNSFHRNKKVIAVAKQGLIRFGYKAEGSSSLWHALVQTALTLRMVREYRRNLSSIQLCEDKDYYAQCKIMRGQFFALLGEDAVQLLTAYSKFIRYGLKKGINVDFVDIFSSYEVLIQRVFSIGYPYWPKDMFTQLSLLLPRHDDLSFTSRYAYSVIHQLQDPFGTEAGLLKAVRASLEQSEQLFMNLAALTFIVCNQGKLSQLEEMLRLFEHKNNHLFNLSTLHYKNYVMDYYGSWKREDQLYSFIQLQDNGQPEDIDNFIAIQRAEQAYLAGEYGIGIKWVRQARTNELEQDWIRNRRLRVYEALLAAELVRSTDGKQREEYKRMVVRCAKRMQSWQGAYGLESSSYYLVRAEANRLAGRMEKALHDYELAVKKAKTEEHWLLQGIAYERQAYAYQEKGFESGFMISLVDAWNAYRKWGAEAKAAALLSEHPQLMVRHSSEASVNGIASGPEVTPHLPSNEQDHRHVMTMGHAQDAWKWLDKLTYNDPSIRNLNKLLDMIQQQTGAERGLLLQLDDDQYELIAATEAIIEDGTPLESLAALPILRYVNRTHETILLAHAGTSRYKSDVHIQAHGVKSLLCMTVRLQAESRHWLLYLESRSISEVFSNRTIDMIQLLITRFAYLQFISESKLTGESVEVSREAKLMRATTKMQGELVESLTSRELEVLQLLSTGLSNRDIAKQLFVSESTIKTHVSNVYGKLGVKRRTQAVKRAEELDLL